MSSGQRSLVNLWNARLDKPPKFGVKVYLSVSLVDPEMAAPGSRLSIIWGEPNGDMAKPSVHPHHQVTIACEAQPWPINEAVRKAYREQA